MKKLITLILMLVGLTTVAHAQLGNTLTIPSGSAPSGSCAFPQLWNRTDAQHLYYCDASTNTWVEMGASGGSTNLGTSGSVTITRPNEGTTGTTLNTLTKIVNSPQVALKLATTDVLTGVGITTSGAGTTGNATISVIGTASCVFDNATTTNDYFVASTTVTLATATNALCHIFEFSGNKTTGFFDAKGSTVTTLNTVSTGAGVAQAKEIVLALFASYGSDTVSFVAGTGFGHGLSNSNTYASKATVFTEVGDVFTGLSGVQTATTTGQTNSPFNVVATFELN